MRNLGLISVGGTKKFDVDLATFAERLADGLERERGRVAIAAEMSKHDPIDFSGKQFFDHGGGRVIREMSVPRLDPLFHRPGPMRVALQKFFVVVSLDHERVHFEAVPQSSLWRNRGR